MAIESLYEKRSSTREAALSNLIKLMTTEYQYEECMFKEETLTRLFITSFRKGGTKEAALAARALGLHTVTLGPGIESEKILEEASNVFSPGRLTGKSSDVKIAAIEALSMIYFVASDDALAALNLMNELSTVYAKEIKAPDVQTAAIKSWTFLFTTMSADQLEVAFIEKQLKMLSALLYNVDVNVRTAAGEAIAAIWNECDVQSLPASQDIEAEDEHNEKALIAQNIEDIVSRMQELAVNRGDETRRSKKDRVSLKSAFRDLVDIMDGGRPPEQRLKLNYGDVLTVSSLEGIIQLNFFRTFLAEGLQVHLQKNELLHQIFEFSPRQEPPETLSKREKRVRTSLGKARSYARDLDRLNKYS